jgi:predicted flap endonuclease-1-like 5' DNA nuclease
MAETTGKRKSAGEDGSNKKQKTGFAMNLNRAVDKEWEGTCFRDVLKAPPHTLQGLAPRSDEVLAKFGIKTVEDLANWKFYHICKMIVTLAAVEDEDAREAKAKFNVNNALDKNKEAKSFNALLKDSTASVQGIGPALAGELEKLRVKTVEDLGTWKYCKWAEAIKTGAEYEFDDLAKHKN